MEVKDYKPRVCDVELQEQLEASGAVVIEGAKWCGKTYTARYADSVFTSFDAKLDEKVDHL